MPRPRKPCVRETQLHGRVRGRVAVPGWAVARWAVARADRRVAGRGDLQAREVAGAPAEDQAKAVGRGPAEQGLKAPAAEPDRQEAAVDKTAMRFDGPKSLLRARRQ